MRHDVHGIIRNTMKKQSLVYKQTFEVWHFNTPEQITEGYSHPDRAIARWLNNHEQYRKVADVTARDLDEVWGITQNVNDSWTRNPNVIWSKSHMLRSTSVGDVFVQNDKAWLVAQKGFKAIAEPKAKP